MDYNDYRNDFILTFQQQMMRLIEKADHMTPIEGIMFLLLCDMQIGYGSDQFSIYQQKQIDKYRVDFFISYHYPYSDRKPVEIVIECDGHDFHEKTKQQATKDKQRDRFFTTSGYHVLRYTGSEIVNNIAITLNKDINDLINTPE